jgi:nucleoside-diphosphate-sugar epimerase
MFRAVSTVSRELRELRETSYQFEEPFVVDHSKFEAAFGADPTSHETAIDRTLDWYRS